MVGLWGVECYSTPLNKALFIHYDSFKTRKQADLSLTEEQVEIQQLGDVFPPKNAVSHGTLNNRTEV